MTDATNPTTTPVTAQAPAAAANAPTTGAAPEADNLALRYTYSELNPRHKDMADRIAALIIAYPDIVKLNDPKAQQDFIDRFYQTQSGKDAKAMVDKAKSSGSAVFDMIAKYDPTGITTTMKASKDAAESTAGVVHAFGQGIDVAKLPLTIPLAAIGTFYNEAKVLGNDITPEKAQLIATRYASTMQTRAVEREGKTAWGAFTSLSSAWAVAKALFVTAMDWVCDKLPADSSFAKVMQDWGFSPKRTLADNLNRQFAEADIETVGVEMKKLKQRDGVDYEAMAPALTQKGTTLQNRAGENVALTPPSADSAIPTLPKAALDAKGNPMVVEPNAAAVLKDATAKAGVAAKEKVDQATNGISTEGQVAALGGGVALAGQGARGVAEGVAKQWVVRPDARATALTNKVETLASTIANAEAADPKTSRLQFWKKTPEQIAEMKDDLTALKAQAVKEGQVAAARAANAGNFTQGALPAVKSGNLIEWVWDAPRKIGRGFGNVTGAIGEKFVELTGRGVVKSAELAAKAPAAVIEAAPTVGAAVGGTARVFGTFVAPAMETFNVVSGMVTGDKRQVFTANASILTITGGVLVGVAAAAAVGAAGIAAAPFIATGLAAGGIATLGTSWAAGKYYDSKHTEQPVAPTPKPAGALGATDKGIAEAINVATQNAEQARLAQAVTDNASDVQRARMAANRTPFTKTQVLLGSTVTGMPAPTGNLPQGSFAQMSLPPMA